MTDRFLEFLQDEINFHESHHDTWYYLLFCKLTGSRPAKDVVIGEIKWIRHYYQISKGLPEVDK